MNPLQLYDKIKKSLTAAMKEQRQNELLVWRGLKSAVDTEVKKGRQLTDELVLATVRSEVKRRREAAALYRGAGEEERAAAEEREQQLLQTLLPAQLDEAAIAALINQKIKEAGQPQIADFGRLMGQISQELQGRADMTVVARLLRQALNND